MRFYCAFPKDDELQSFAKHWLSTFSILNMKADPSDLIDVGPVRTSVLHKEGQFQVELCMIDAGYVIPEHVHPNMDSIEVPLSGGVRFTINGIDPYVNVNDDRLIQFGRGKGWRINSDDVHGGRVMGSGAVFLSIQHWKTEPKKVLSDYVGGFLSRQHEGLCQ